MYPLGSFSTKPRRSMPKLRTTLFDSIAACLLQDLSRSRSVPTSSTGTRVPVRSLAWQVAQLLSKTALPAFARSSLIGNGYLRRLFLAEIFHQPIDLLHEIFTVMRRGAQAARAPNR